MIETDECVGVDTRRALPAGWRWARLGDVCELNPRRPSLHRPDEAPTTFVPMSAVEEDGNGISRPEIRPFSDVRSGYTYFAEGDMLFAKITPCMQNGKHAVARNLVNGIGFGSTEFHVIRPGSDITSEWIHSFLLQPWVLRDAMAHFSGSVGQQRVPQSYLEGLQIPLPPLTEQRRIAAILAEQMAAVERARAAAEAQLAAAKALPAAYLRGVFESDEAREWPVCHIGDVARVQSGYAFKSEWFTPQGIRLLRNANVFQGRIEWSDSVYLPLDRRAEFSSFELLEGDIVLSLDRPVVSNGLKVARMTRDDIPSLLLQRVGRFRISQSVVPSYLSAFLNSHAFIAEITHHDQSLGVPHVSPGQVEAVMVPLPSLDVQYRVAAQLEDQMAAVERTRDAIQQQLDAINALPAALLRQAFNGEL